MPGFIQQAVRHRARHGAMGEERCEGEHGEELRSELRAQR